MKELLYIQQNLNAPKNQYNKFGNYNYRSCEDILEAVKPHLLSQECTLNIVDSIELIGDRYYVKATAILTNKDGQTAIAQAYAREQEKVTGQIEAQITGAASSYARKYALNGLFLIDDNKDPDATNTHGKETRKTSPTTAVKTPIEESTDNPLDIALLAVEKATTRKELEDIYKANKTTIGKDATFVKALNEKAATLK